MPDMPRILFAVASVAVVAAVAYGITLIDSPGRARLERFDQTRADIVGQMVIVADCVRSQTGRYPETLEELRETAPAQCQPDTFEDPATGEPFIYRRAGDGFEICAVYALAHENTRLTGANSPMSEAELQRHRIQYRPSHPAGEHCHRFDPLEPDSVD